MGMCVRHGAATRPHMLDVERTLRMSALVWSLNSAFDQRAAVLAAGAASDTFAAKSARRVA
jgi:hypothetical protein